jgi:hypothetical protein
MGEEFIMEKAQEYMLKARERLELLRNSEFVFGDANFEDEVWVVYSFVEAAISFIKVANNREYPFSSWSISGLMKANPSNLLLDASRHLIDSISSISQGKIEKCISELRASRNCLRTFLIISKKKRILMKKNSKLHSSSS